MSYQIVNVKNDRTFIQYKMIENDPLLKWASETAYQKVRNTQDDWQERNDCQRFIDIMLGDLAKNVIADYISSKSLLSQQNLIEYDKIRNDNFQRPDQFDLSIDINNQKHLEIKSSAEKYSNRLSDIFYKRNIIINIGNIHEHYNWIVIQVFFIPQNLEFFKKLESPTLWKNPNQDLEAFIEHVLPYFEKNVDIYITGWADYNMQLEAAQKIFSVENPETRAERRTYAKMPIYKAKDPSELIPYLEKTLNNAH